MRDTDSNPDLLKAEAVLEWLADFSRVLVHDLAQPLAAASNYLTAARQMAQAQTAGASLEQTLDKAAAQITRASEGLRRLEASLNAQEPRFGKASLHALLQQAASRVERQTEARIALSLDAQQDVVLVDAAQIEQTLATLIGSAARLGAAPLRIQTLSDADWIRVQILAPPRESGRPPVPQPADLKVALALARAILAAHDAALEVAPAGKGLVVSLPLAGA